MSPHRLENGRKWLKRITLGAIAISLILGVGPLAVVFTAGFFVDAGSRQADALAYLMVATLFWAMAVAGPLTAVAIVTGILWASLALSLPIATSSDSQPNPTVETDARNSGARGSP